MASVRLTGWDFRNGRKRMLLSMCKFEVSVDTSWVYSRSHGTKGLICCLVRQLAVKRRHRRPESSRASGLPRGNCRVQAQAWGTQQSIQARGCGKRHQQPRYARLHPGIDYHICTSHVDPMFDICRCFRQTKVDAYRSIVKYIRHIARTLPHGRRACKSIRNNTVSSLCGRSRHCLP